MTSTVHQPRAQHTATPTLRPWYAVTLVGGLLGILTAGWQTVERISYASDPGSLSVCEINSTLSCSSVFDHWQSSALGIPNALVALPVFALLAATGLAGLLGSRLSAGYLRVALGLTLFMTAFVTWYMYETAFSIQVLCLFCAGCLVNIIIAGVGITRVVSGEHALGRARTDHELGLLVSGNADLIVWGGLLAAIGLMLFLGLAL